MIADYYLLIKALHILAVIAWMAGLLYLPRLFVYHATLSTEDSAYALLSTMEKRLLSIIMRWAAVAVATFEVMLLFIPGIVDMTSGWFHVKLLAVLGLFALHGMMAQWARAFWEKRNTRSHTFFRFINEIPFVLAIVAVLMVVMKPF